MYLEKGCNGEISTSADTLRCHKKLIRGKRVIIEGGESKWVFFRYKRLPNFCYWCGMLDHGEKDCQEKMSTTNEGGRGCI